MSTLRWSALTLAVAIALLGCDSSNTQDAGDAASDSAMDASDVVYRAPEPFGPCTSNTECLPGWRCRPNTEGFPQGVCTKDCEVDEDCADPAWVARGVQGICPPPSVNPDGVCQLLCLNGYDCRREGYTCRSINAATGDAICIPTCDPNTSAPGSCGDGARCNEWTGRCQPLDAPRPPPGVDNGERCTRSGAGSECRSTRCIAEIRSNLPTGWNGGSCISTCALPVGYTATSFWSGDRFPQANCPAGSICFPGDDLARRSEGTCLAECESNADCRVAEGYYCRRRFPRGRGTYTWQNGYCAPVDCLQASTPCPAGFSCLTLQSGSGSSRVIFGVCARGNGDGGTDGGTDAASDANGPNDAGGDAANDATSDAGLDASGDSGSS